MGLRVWRMPPVADGASGRCAFRGLLPHLLGSKGHGGVCVFRSAPLVADLSSAVAAACISFSNRLRLRQVVLGAAVVPGAFMLQDGAGGARARSALLLSEV